MSIKLLSASVKGIEGSLINIEVDIAKGLPAFNIVGLGDTSIKESKERVRSALVNSGYEMPLGHITINLAPADLRKEGSLFDLPIALGILLASNQIKLKNYEKIIIIGELSLSGKVNRIKGALPLVLSARDNKIKEFIIPLENAEECTLVKDVDLYALNSLKEVVDFLTYRDLKPYKLEENFKFKEENLDLRDIYGQEAAKRALEIAVAGGHSLLFFGPPGSGKSMLANRIPSIMPPLSYDELLEVTKIYSVYGSLEQNAITMNRPFRSPHHTSTPISIIGGGSKLLPGEISLAHKGVLFLDEVLEFKKSTLELLRQPLEEKKISLNRYSGTVEYPCDCMIVSSINPCQCGYYGSNKKQCTCNEYSRKKYLGKLSGPFLDRIDMFICVNGLDYSEINEKGQGESSLEIRERIVKAREYQRERYNSTIRINSSMNNKDIKKYCFLDEDSKEILEKIYSNYNLSVRAYNRILKVARSIADLEMSSIIKKQHVVEALNYRKFVNGEII